MADVTIRAPTTTATADGRHPTDWLVVPRHKDIVTHPTGPLRHCGGAGRHVYIPPLQWQTQRALRSRDSKPPRSYVTGPAFPGARPCLMSARDRAPRPTSGRYTFRALAHLHASPLRWHALRRRLAAPLRWSPPRGVARHNPILPAICCLSCKQVGRRSGRLPIFRSRGLAGGRGRPRLHCGGASPTRHCGGAAPLGEIPQRHWQLKATVAKRKQLRPPSAGPEVLLLQRRPTEASGRIG